MPCPPDHVSDTERLDWLLHQLVATRDDVDLALKHGGWLDDGTIYGNRPPQPAGHPDSRLGRPPSQELLEELWGSAMRAMMIPPTLQVRHAQPGEVFFRKSAAPIP